MKINILDNQLKKVGYIKKGHPLMPTFVNDTWHRYLAEGTSTFDFTVNKFVNGEFQEYCRHINDQAFFSFRYKGEDFLFYVLNITEDDFSIQLSCNNLNLELKNEMASQFVSEEAQPLTWYLEKMGLLGFAVVRVGLNEISDRKRTLRFESEETKLSRLISLIKQFDGEFEFKTKLNKDGSFKEFILNIYHEHDDQHQGVGRLRSDVTLRYGNEIKGVQRSINKEQLYNALIAIGTKTEKVKKDDGEEEVTTEVNINDLDREIKNEAGEIEFYTRKGSKYIFAPLSQKMYPSSTNPDDDWTAYTTTTEYSSTEDLWGYMLRWIKEHAYPQVTYTVSVRSDMVDGRHGLELGDIVKIRDKNFVGGLILKARIIEQTISFSNPNNNQFVFSNIQKLKSAISSNLQERLEKMAEAAQSYEIDLFTDRGTQFKNGVGESIVSPELRKGRRRIVSDVTYRFTFGQEVTAGQTYRVLASKVPNTQVLTVAAYIGNIEVARKQLSFIGTSDGADGPPGPKGDKGAVDEEQLKDINQRISDKADKSLTQEQLNALTEAMQLAKAELEAKASIDTVNEWVKSYQDYVKADEVGRAAAEAKLIAASQRVVEIENNLGDMAERWSFLDSYMSASNEGVIIGKKDGSTSARFESDRISFYSAGSEVAYISQGVLKIENGIFTRTLQIGRFREEQYQLNPDMNVIRYVGGGA